MVVFTVKMTTFTDWLTRIREYPQLLLEYKLLKQSNINLQEDFLLLTETYAELHDDYLEVINEVELLRAKLDKKERDVMDSTFWNTKWKQSTIYYNAPKRKKVVDYVTYREIESISSISSFIIANNALHPGCVDNVPLAVMNWTNDMFDDKELKYKHDPGKTDLWRTPEETLSLKYGDCDDISILEYYITRQIFKDLGIWDENKHRLKFICGNVNRRGSIPSSAGGHAYLNWLADDGNFYTFESTYYLPNAIRNYKKLPQKLNPIYSTIWFSFNEQYSWSQHSISVSENDFKKI